MKKRIVWNQPVSSKGWEVQRVLDIPVEKETMIVPVDDRMTQSEMSDYLKEKSQTYYGTAFKAFALDFVRWASSSSDWQEGVNQSLGELIVYYRSQVDKVHEKRAAENFAIVHYAGKLAVSFGVLPFSEDTIAESVQFAFDAWKDALGGKDELDYELDKLRGYIADNQNHFGNPASEERLNSNVGYKFTVNGTECFAFERTQFEAMVTPSLSYRRFLKRLDERGLLCRIEGDRLYGRRTVSGMGDLSLYFINQNILSD